MKEDKTLTNNYKAETTNVYSARFTNYSNIKEINMQKNNIDIIRLLVVETMGSRIDHINNILIAVNSIFEFYDCKHSKTILDYTSRIKDVCNKLEIDIKEIEDQFNIGCNVCKLFRKYEWDIPQIEKFNKFIQFIQEKYNLSFTEYQRERLKFEFNIPVEDINTLNHYHILRHKRECIIDESVALTVGEQEPEDFISRKEARELISNFRKLDYKDKKNVAVQNLTERTKELLTTIENLQYILDGDERK